MIDYARIHRTANWRSRKIPSTSLYEAGDLENEAVVAALRGRQSYDGPMQDFQRKQGMIGNHKSGRNNFVRVPFEGRNLPVTRSHAAQVIADVTLEKMLARLTPKQREAIELRHIEGLREREIAQRLDISIDAFRKRHADGMANLRKMAA